MNKELKEDIDALQGRINYIQKEMKEVLKRRNHYNEKYERDQAFLSKLFFDMNGLMKKANID